MELSKYYIDLDSKDLAWKIFWLLAVVSVIFTMSDLAFASNTTTKDDPFGNAICRVYLIIIGNPAKGAATIVIIFTCAAAAFGKIKTETVIIVVGGIGGVFAAPKLVELLSPGTTEICTDITFDATTSGSSGGRSSV